MAHALMLPQVDALIDLALSEDIGTGDRTTLATIGEDDMAAARVLAKEDLVLAGVPYFARVFERLDPSVRVTPVVAEGARVAAMTVVAKVVGPARSLLVGERTALNLLQRLCGTATMTRRYADALEGTAARVADTRKTSPGMRVVEKYAVLVGGGSNHRFGLDSGILIKDNHIAACGGLAEAVRRCRAVAPHGLKVETEARTMDEVDAAIAVKADIIMLDNMTTAAMREAVSRIRASPHPTVIEASGNLTLARLPEVAAAGVDILSVGALTHSAVASDLSMKFVSEP